MFVKVVHPDDSYNMYECASFSYNVLRHHATGEDTRTQDDVSAKAPVLLDDEDLDFTELFLVNGVGEVFEDVRLIVGRVFVMNNDGRTIDSFAVDHQV